MTKCVRAAGQVEYMFTFAIENSRFAASLSIHRPLLPWTRPLPLRTVDLSRLESI